MTRYEEVRTVLRATPRKWLITGVAGFIGSNLLEALLKLDQDVVGLDNHTTGYEHNLKEVRAAVTLKQWASFRMVNGDICCTKDCEGAVWYDGKPVDYVLHQAALGSVPRSLADPVRSHQANVDGFLNMLVAARDAKVRAFVYASSSSVYGDHPDLPKVEDQIGEPLSPYAATKRIDEMYAATLARCFKLSATGLRYFNVFGRRQSPAGEYAAVIPRWFSALIHSRPVTINGDGETSRDFCYVDNVVQANLLAAWGAQPGRHEVYNVAAGARTTLKGLQAEMRRALSSAGVSSTAELRFETFRPGDVRHSLANIDKAKRELGYQPTHTVTDGLNEAVHWYINASQ